jgi:hypothetical protein
VEEERWQQQLARLKAVLSGPGVEAWWATSGSSAILSARFVALVEEILAENVSAVPEVPPSQVEVLP